MDDRMTAAAGARRAAAADVPRLLAMMHAFCVGERLVWDGAQRRQLLAGLLADGAGGEVWLLEQADTAVGYFVLGFGFSFEYGGRDAFLDELYVLPEQRGRGHGTRALAHAAAACRAAGVGALHLEVDHDNPRARALYERCGFSAHPRFLMTRRGRQGNGDR